MKHYPRYLSFEVTRQCNLRCEHCMRGDAQNLDMTTDIIDKILDDICEIHYLNFTGGEPTLNIKLIKYIISEIKRRNIPVYGFDIVSNGKDKKLLKELCCVLEDFKEYCVGKNVDDSRLAISYDEYHSKEVLPTGQYLFTIKYKGSNKEDHDNVLLNLGRARKLVNKEKTNKDIMDTFIYRGNEFYHMDFTSIVISANGDVRLTVDYEYNSKIGVVGNLHINSLNDILEKISYTEESFYKFMEQKRLESLIRYKKNVI